MGMKFRYARHTNNLALIEKFYTEIIGLKKLGEFENHSNYNGIFLGKPENNWHLEFTESNEPAIHTPDEDDLIVFYLDSQDEIDRMLKNARQLNAPIVKPKNPYWQNHGTELRDPDNYGVILTIQ
ncbi:VOC family protein [Aureibacter tunicatorum]|uniref:Lactoylglutathione lyase n=1 Tax=Aureibacter tunicatorum TaxID=866807 RepID=A0AAE3XP87_9BACT|nr:VOC family protein [Aureibacter tunicatorum]MDR6241551.1 putative lactoylglutathione lyase [Aureibacter tunicatorum]BDD07225.1 hypothetical protein AUTU_47080 [Aureibacter tunicatorum]